MNFTATSEDKTETIPKAASSKETAPSTTMADNSNLGVKESKPETSSIELSKDQITSEVSLLMEYSELPSEMQELLSTIVSDVFEGNLADANEKLQLVYAITKSIQPQTLTQPQPRGFPLSKEDSESNIALCLSEINELTKAHKLDEAAVAAYHMRESFPRNTSSLIPWGHAVFNLGNQYLIDYGDTYVLEELIERLESDISFFSREKKELFDLIKKEAEALLQKTNATINRISIGNEASMTDLVKNIKQCSNLVRPIRANLAKLLNEEEEEDEKEIDYYMPELLTWATAALGLGSLLKTEKGHHYVLLETKRKIQDFLNLDLTEDTRHQLETITDHIDDLLNPPSQKPKSRKAKSHTQLVSVASLKSPVFAAGTSDASGMIKKQKIDSVSAVSLAGGAEDTDVEKPENQKKSSQLTK